LIKTGIPARVSLGFRLGGKDLSLEVCNSIPESMTKAKNSCREKIEYLIDSEDCSGIRGELTDLICEYN